MLIDRAQDALVDDMAFKQWQDTTSGKIQGTQTLYSILGRSLDFFIMLSSVVGTVPEALSKLHSLDSYPPMAVQYEAWTLAQSRVPATLGTMRSRSHSSHAKA